MADRYNASLIYKGRQGKNKGFGLWVMEYEQSHSLAGEEIQSTLFKRFYPRSYAPSPMTVKGRVRTQHRYEQLAKFIRDHQLYLIDTPGLSNAGKYQLPLLKLSIPSENVYVEGFIGSFQAGARRFNVAPEYTFDFFTIKDNHSANANIRPSHPIRMWWSGQIIEEGEIIEDRTEEYDAMNIPGHDPDGLGRRGGR